MKRLYRSEENRIFGGVIGGIGEYWNVDPTLIRVFWVAILIFSGIVPGLLVYILALCIVPRRRGGVAHPNLGNANTPPPNNDS